MDDKGKAFSELTERLKAALTNNERATVAQMIEDLKKLKNTPLVVAITGKSGSGRSSFVNAFSGINDSHEEAAPTGYAEKPSDIKSYPHPDYPNVTLWDLPGIGNTKFPANKYMELVEFHKFHFFIIISATRLWEDDVKLAREVTKMGKKFYFVRTNIDNDMRAEKRTQMSFSEEKSLEKIRQNCIEGLRNEGIQSDKVFLVSNSDLGLYDGPLLCSTFKADLPALRIQALPFIVADINQKIIYKKKEAYQTFLKYLVVLSAVGAVVPVPGLYAGIYVGLMVIVVRRYTAGFGLNVPSLQRLSGSMRVPFQEVKAVIRSPLTLTEIIKNVTLKVLGQLVIITALTAIRPASGYIGTCGTMAAMSFCAYRNYRVLSSVLDMLAHDAQRVFRRALGL